MTDGPLDRKCGVSTFYHGYWAEEGGFEHCCSAVLRLLRRVTARWCRLGEEIWNGALGAFVHVAMGGFDGIACLGAVEVAAVYIADCNRLPRR